MVDEQAETASERRSYLIGIDVNWGVDINVIFRYNRYVH